MSAALTVGSWQVQAIPAEWEILPGHGLRRTGDHVFPSTIVFSEENMPAGLTLPTYIKNQIEGMKVLFRNLRIKGPVPIAMPEANEAQRVGVSYKSADGHEVIHVQIYATAADLVGIVTLTTVTEEASKISAMFQDILANLRFRAPGQKDKVPKQ